MNDYELFRLAVGYHQYLQFGNSSQPAYAWMVTRHVWFDDHDILSREDLPQIFRVTRLVRRYLKMNTLPPPTPMPLPDPTPDPPKPDPKPS